MSFVDFDLPILFELAPDPKSTSPSLSCRRYVLKTSAEFPTDKLGISPSDLLPHLDKEDAYSLISDVTMSPCLKKVISPTPVAKLACWSPMGILHNRRCILALLTDMGSLWLYVLVHDEFTQNVSVSDAWRTHCTATWADPKNSSKLEELRNRAENIKLTGISCKVILLISADTGFQIAFLLESAVHKQQAYKNLITMCWLDEVKDNTGWLASGSKSGVVSLWMVKCINSNKPDLTLTLINRFDTDFTILTTLHWTTLPSKDTLLTVAALDGRIRRFTLTPISSAVHITSTPDNVSANNNPSVRSNSARDIWQDKDRIAVSHITSWPWREGLVLAVAKGGFVIIFYLYENLEKQEYATYKCSDVTVNGLQKLSADEVLLASRSSRFTRLTLSLGAKNKLFLKPDAVESYINISHLTCYGLNLTQNNVICFIFLSVNQSYDHLRLREPTQVMVCSVTGLANPQQIIEDANKPISQMWDCLELIRVQVLQKIIDPGITCSNSYRSILDGMAIDQLTCKLWLVTFALAAEEDESKRKSLMNLRQEIEMLVQSCHFFKRISLLLSGPLTNFTDFQLQSLGLYRKFLLLLQNLPEEYTTTLITGQTVLQEYENIEVPADEQCSICASLVPDLQDLYSSKCEKGHQFPRCSLSLVQCSQLPYFKCSQCSVLAHHLAVEDCGNICNLCGGNLQVNEDLL